MKNLIMIFSIFAVLAMVSSCAVNATTGSITVLNNTDKAANNIKVGSVNIGYVGAGQSVNVFFFSEEVQAQVTVDGFSAGGLQGKIDLKLNYMYSLGLYNDPTTPYYFAISGRSISDTSKTATVN